MEGGSREAERGTGAHSGPSWGESLGLPSHSGRDDCRGQTQTSQQLLTLKVEIDVVVSQTHVALDVNNLPQHTLGQWTSPSPSACWGRREGNSWLCWGMSKDSLTPCPDPLLRAPTSTGKAAPCWSWGHQTSLGNVDLLREASPKPASKSSRAT